jgi:hypothetical protein
MQDDVKHPQHYFKVKHASGAPPQHSMNKVILSAGPDEGLLQRFAKASLCGESRYLNFLFLAVSEAHGHGSMMPSNLGGSFFLFFTSLGTFSGAVVLGEEI